MSTLCKKTKQANIKKKAEKRVNRVQDEDSLSGTETEDSDSEHANRLYTLTPWGIHTIK